MRRILNIFLILTLLFTLTIPAYAWSSEDPYTNVSGLEILNNAPVLFEGGDGVLYDSSTSTYYGFGGYEGMSYGHYYKVDSSSGALTINNYSSGQLQVYKWNGSQWIDQQIYSTWNMDGYTFVNCSRNFFVDDSLLQWDGYTLTFNGEVINPPSGGDSEEDDNEHGGGSGSRDDYDDMSDSGFLQGILDGITAFFTGLFEGLLSVVDFVITLLTKIGELFEVLGRFIIKLPDFFTEFLKLFSPDGVIISTAENFFKHNTYANSIFLLLIACTSYGFFNMIKGLVKTVTSWF